MSTRIIIGLAVFYLGGTCTALSDTPTKNVLFIVSDDLKASALGCYGNTVCQTPNIDKLARSGLVFNRAYCQGTWCAPSRKRPSKRSPSSNARKS